MRNTIREWRQTGIYQPPRRTTSQPHHDILPSPTVSASRKKQKTSHSVPPSLVFLCNANLNSTVSIFVLADALYETVLIVSDQKSSNSTAVKFLTQDYKEK
jgi:4-hydroxy-3-methylbut-2-enyl diphosphate reductase IspH